MEALWLNLTDVLVQPVRAFRRLREKPMVLWALVFVVLSELALSLTPEVALRGLDPRSQIGGPFTLLFVHAVTVIITLFLGALAIQIVGQWLGGQGAYRPAVSALGFASLPGLLQAPVYVLAELAGVAGIAALGQVAVGVWSAVLNVLAVREVYTVSTGRAVAIILLSVIALALIALGGVVSFAILFGLALM